MKIWGIKGLGRERQGIIDEIIGVKWGFLVRDIFTDYSRLRALRLIFLLSSPVFSISDYAKKPEFGLPT